MEEKNNPQQDKGIDELLNSFEIELQDREEENKGEVENVKYYGTFKIKEIEFQNIFIMAETDHAGKQIQHVYSGNTSNELLTIDAEGNVDIKNPALQKYLSGLDFTKTLKQNDARLRAISGKGKPEEIKKALEGENGEQDTEVEEIDADLQKQGQDLEITSYKPIKDSHVAERIPEVFGNGEEHGIAYSSKLNRFVIASKVDGQYQINENVEPSKVTLRSIISIDEKGEKIERKVPYALMKLPNDPNKEIAVTIGQYGIVDIQTVDLLPNQQRLGRQAQVGGETSFSGEEEYNTRRDFKTEGKYYSRDIVEGVQELEQQDANNGIIDRDKTEDDLIPNTNKTWGQLMKDTGESLPKLIERYNREMENNGHDSKKAVDIMEDDFGKVNREHKQ